MFNEKILPTTEKNAEGLGVQKVDDLVLPSFASGSRKRQDWCTLHPFWKSRAWQAAKGDCPPGPIDILWSCSFLDENQIRTGFTKYWRDENFSSVALWKPEWWLYHTREACNCSNWYLRRSLLVKFKSRKQILEPWEKMRRSNSKLISTELLSFSRDFLPEL